MPNVKTNSILATILLATSLSSGVLASHAMAENAVVVPAAAVLEPVAGSGMEKAVLAGGCFWGVQGVFQHVKGVQNAISGYAGGKADTAAYETVSGGQTGHAESVEITFDPQVINYATLLQIYFSVVADPTELNYQGPDSGTQYRSAIFPESDAQAQVARAYIDQLNKAGVFKAPIVTTIEPSKAFYAAEGYHQDYLTLHPNQPYIAFNDIPKVNDLSHYFPNLYSEKPKLVKG
jgi:peptide-methionine (S)-S-oxide reductase